jgi:hypothetical protein
MDWRDDSLAVETAWRKRAIEDALRRHGRSRAQATTFVARTWRASWATLPRADFLALVERLAAGARDAAR